MTPHGWRRMRDELTHLVKVDRPEVTDVVSWAASNGDRSENGDYQYGKKRLREIDRRIRYLTKRLENAEVVDPAPREETDQVFFAATVTYANAKGEETTVRIVGLDETDLGAAATSAGSRPWRGPSSRRARAIPCRSSRPAGARSWRSSRCATRRSPWSPFVPAKSLWSPNAK